MPEIRIRGNGETIVCENGAGLLQTLLAHGVFVDNPCNGTGVCGKCKVRGLGNNENLIGAVSEMTETERKLLKPEEIAGGVRLSCMTKVYGDIQVELLQKERKHRVLTGGYMPQFEPDSFDGGYGVAVDIGTTTVAMALIDLATGEEVANASDINAQKHFGLDVLTRITYEYEHGETGIQELQKAIVDSMNGMLAEMCAHVDAKTQTIFGGDKQLHQYGDREDRNNKSINSCRSEIREIVVAANCTMTHMLLGVDARSIGRAPYAPVFKEAQVRLASEIGLHAAEDTKVYCLPQVSSYIGADIVAGAYVCEMEKQTGNVLFIDIGTNGEIVLASGGKLLSCSCAAGPALEGMNISCGMRAADGAIEDIRMKADGVEIDVIGGGEPAGLCGSGILAAVRELIKNGFLKKTGAFVQVEALAEDDWRKNVLRNEAVAEMNQSESEETITAGGRKTARTVKREAVIWEQPASGQNSQGSSAVIVTQDDVRQVQLAKGAILSGFTALLKKAGITMEELDKVLIAGQFGAHLPAESLVGVGILPAEVKEKIVYVGNSSKTGAYMALMSKQARLDMEALAENIDYFELAETNDYERVFAECMRFPVVRDAR